MRIHAIEAICDQPRDGTRNVFEPDNFNLLIHHTHPRSDWTITGRYRMLGTVSDAEDIVQETLLRLHRAMAAGEQIDSARGFVATVTTRLSINELRSARGRREEYVGQWLPEPIITDSTGDPLQHAEMLDSLSLAMLVGELGSAGAGEIDREETACD